MESTKTVKSHSQKRKKKERNVWYTFALDTKIILCKIFTWLVFHTFLESRSPPSSLVEKVCSLAYPLWRWYSYDWTIYCTSWDTKWKMSELDKYCRRTRLRSPRWISDRWIDKLSHRTPTVSRNNGRRCMQHFLMAIATAVANRRILSKSDTSIVTDASLSFENFWKLLVPIDIPVSLNFCANIFLFLAFDVSNHRPTISWKVKCFPVKITIIWK